MRNESDNETSIVSNIDTLSSSDDCKRSEEADNSNEGKSSEESNVSDEKADPINTSSSGGAWNVC